MDFISLLFVFAACLPIFLLFHFVNSHHPTSLPSHVCILRIICLRIKWPRDISVAAVKQASNYTLYPIVLPEIPNSSLCSVHAYAYISCIYKKSWEAVFPQSPGYYHMFTIIKWYYLSLYCIIPRCMPLVPFISLFFPLFKTCSYIHFTKTFLAFLSFTFRGNTLFL